MLQQNKKIIEKPRPHVSVYDLTGKLSYEYVTVQKSYDNGREMTISSTILKGLAKGDTILLDRPHFPRTAFSVKECESLSSEPDCVIASVKVVSEHIGGSQKKLRFKFRHSVYRK